MENSAKHLIIVAGEASGDLHAAHLVTELKQCDSQLTFSGIGGSAMQKAGVELYRDMTQMAVVGFWEVLKYYGKIRQVFHSLLKKIDKTKPRAVILVDYPGFNLRLAREIKKRCGTKIIYYISPQVWAWKARRVHLIKQVVDRMLVLFPFEKEFYNRYGMDVTFVGHPLLDTIEITQSPEVFLNSLGLSPQKRTVALLPGSREKEIELILPVMLKAAEILRAESPNLQFVLLLAPTIALMNIQKYLKKMELPLKIAEHNTYNGINASEVCLVASGTATLEVAILKKPMIVIYKTSLFTWMLAKLFIKIPYIGLVNVVAGKKIVPECIQFQATGQNVAAELKGILGNPSRTGNIKTGLQRVKTFLGENGAVGRAAKEILKELKLS